MRTSFSMDPLTVDPRKCGDRISSTLIFMLYEGLTQILPNGKVECALAESVDISEDGCVYLFHLRRAQWSDGTPISALDFEHSWKKTLDPSFPSSCPQLFFPIKNGEAASQGLASLDEVGVTAVDAKTLKVELEHPTPYFLSLISCCNFFPIPRHIEMSHLTWDASPLKTLVCSGPFQLVSWEQKRQISLRKNPLHWDVQNTSLDLLNISIVNNEFTTLEMFESGELDWISSLLAAVPLASLKEYQQARKLTLNPAASTLFCAYNTHQFPFHNENVRKALSLAIDRQKIVDQITQLGEIPAKRFIPPILDHQEVELLPPFNPPLAREYLRRGLIELGIINEGKEGSEEGDLKFRLFLQGLTLSCEDSSLSRQVAQSLQEQWRLHLGYRIQLIPQSFKTQMESIYKRDFNIAMRTCFTHYNDPMSLLERFKYKNLSSNFPKFESPRYIELLNLSSQNHPTGLSRSDLLLAAESHLLDRMPLVPIYHGNYPILFHPTVSGISFSAVGNVQLRKAKYTPQKTVLTQAAVC